ncbi:hypothetical protein [Mangrovihabitans endophyticus]|uniref:Fibronectin type-III domain-containing protein n=1 Tax=Mangrovihabitans endophyticus TaxID=1751298 RepID=A0A8J3FNK7_9ACTN|nr:hypothetical protein [Mangrovihabitans endophyticus]GGK84842.1 hypothetical protein GCM10012284_18980 [Mangrovihabitans endophyticus]
MRRGNWVMLLAAPLLLSGCNVVDTLTGTPAAGPVSSGSAAGDAAPTGNSGDNWLVYAEGSPTPSPRPSYPAVEPDPVETGFLPLETASPTPETTPTATCSPNMFAFDKIQTAYVDPGPTSAVVTWYNVGGANLIEFRLTAISQDLTGGRQRDVGWVTVQPSTSCGWMSATVPGLDRQTRYVFSVDAVATRHSGAGTRASTVARSLVTSTT